MCITSEWVKSSFIERFRFPNPACMSWSSSAGEGVISVFLFNRNTENMNGFQDLQNFVGLLQLGRRLLEPRFLKILGKTFKKWIIEKFVKENL